MWNPMLNFYANMMFSDITDWHVAESLGKPMTYEFSEWELIEMHKWSPTALIKNIKIPTLFCVGEKDKWIPP